MGLDAVSLHGVSHGQSQTSDPRLAKSAHEFEASLMGELLKPLQQSDGLTGEEDDGGSQGALAGFACESLARVISERGGFGIADRVLQELHRGKGAATAEAGIAETVRH